MGDPSDLSGLSGVNKFEMLSVGVLIVSVILHSFFLWIEHVSHGSDSIPD